VQNVDHLHGHDCHQNVTEPQATEYQYTCAQHGNCESGLAKTCCTQAGPAHAAGRVAMAWTDESTLATLFYNALLVAPIAVARRDGSPVTGTMSQATMTNGIDKLPCGCLL